MKVELKVREGGVVSPTRQQILFTLWQALSTMSLCCVKVSLKLRADAAITPIYAPKSELYHEIVFFIYLIWCFWPFHLSVQFNALLLALITVSHKNTPILGVQYWGYISQSPPFCVWKWLEYRIVLMIS